MVIKIAAKETLSTGDFLGLSTVDTTAPTVLSVTYGGNDGTLKVGETVTLVVKFSEVVTVVGGSPSLALSSGGTASYSSGTGTDTLTFTYTAASGQNSADLAISSVSLNGATIKDAAGNNANLAGVVINRQAPWRLTPKLRGHRRWR